MTTRRPPRLLVSALGLLAFVLPLAACGGDDGAPIEPGVVQVDDNFFRPKTIDITVGDTVTWRWVGSASHNAVGPGFASEIQGKDTTFEHTFDEAGEVEYVCTIHAGMTGKVRVAGS